MAPKPSRTFRATAARTIHCWRRSPPRLPHRRPRPRPPRAARPSGRKALITPGWCPLSPALEPMVESWKKTMPDYVSFSPVPVMWSEGHRSLARLYYTLQSLGKLDRLHGEVFKEIQEHNDPLIGADPANTAEAERLQTAFAVKS